MNFKIIATAILTLAISACASASLSTNMVPAITEATSISDSSKLKEAVSVAQIDGGQETSPMWTSQVSNEDFAEALRQTLSAHTMLATDSGKYLLSAELVNLQQPAFGISMTVTSTVRYRLIDLATKEVVLEELVENAYTAKGSDAFAGVKRLRLANEGSIKGNIAKIIEKMISTIDGGPQKSTIAPTS